MHSPRRAAVWSPGLQQGAVAAAIGTLPCASTGHCHGICRCHLLWVGQQERCPGPLVPVLSPIPCPMPGSSPFHAHDPPGRQLARPQQGHGCSDGRHVAASPLGCCALKDQTLCRQKLQTSWSQGARASCSLPSLPRAHRSWARRAEAERGAGVYLLQVSVRGDKAAAKPKTTKFGWE